MKTGIFTQKQMEEEEENDRLSARFGIEYFTVKEIMEWIPIKESQLCKKLRKGKIKGRKIGKKWYVTRQEFYNYLEGK